MSRPHQLPLSQLQRREITARHVPRAINKYLKRTPNPEGRLCTCGLYSAEGSCGHPLQFRERSCAAASKIQGASFCEAVISPVPRVLIPDYFCKAPCNNCRTSGSDSAEPEEQQVMAEERDESGGSGSVHHSPPNAALYLVHND